MVNQPNVHFMNDVVPFSVQLDFAFDACVLKIKIIYNHLQGFFICNTN